MSNADVGPRRRADGRRRKQWGASTGIVASGSGEVLLSAKSEWGGERTNERHENLVDAHTSHTTYGDT